MSKPNIDIPYMTKIKKKTIDRMYESYFDTWFFDSAECIEKPNGILQIKRS